MLAGNSHRKRHASEDCHSLFGDRGRGVALFVCAGIAALEAAAFAIVVVDGCIVFMGATAATLAPDRYGF